MSSSCQMYLAQQYTKFRFPVLPEKVEVAYGSNNDKMSVWRWRSNSDPGQRSGQH